MPSRVKVSFYLNDIDEVVDHLWDDAPTMEHLVRSDVISAIGERNICTAYAEAVDLDSVSVDVESFDPGPKHTTFDVAIRPRLTARVTVERDDDFDIDGFRRHLSNLTFGHLSNLSRDPFQVEWADDTATPNEVEVDHYSDGNDGQPI
jgi:hypothetical protein